MNNWKDYVCFYGFLATAILILALFTIGPANVHPQITAPVDSQIETANYKARSFSQANVTGVPLESAELHADPDTIKAVWLSATVDQVIDSTTIVLGVAMRYGDISVNRSLTVNTTAELWLPNTSWSGIPDSLFSIVLNDTLRHVKNWQFKLVVQDVSELRLPLSLTLIKEENLASDVDTVFGSAARADFGTMSWEITASAESADSCQLKLGYQVRLRGGDWRGPTGDDIYIVSDSLVLTSGTTLKVPLILPRAEWVRPAVIGISTTGNVYIETLQAKIK